MICYTITPYVDGQHGRSFHVLIDGIDGLDEICQILEGSDEVQYYEIYDHDRLHRDGGGKWKEALGDE